MSARLLLFAVSAAAISFAYVFFAARYVPETWPWLLRAYGLPALACVLLAYLMRVWRDGSFAAHAIAALACFALPAAAVASMMSVMCALDTGRCA